MNRIASYPKANKPFPAVVAALSMTVLIGLATLAVGANALLNRNTIPLQSSTVVTPDGSADPATVQQLQELVAQYQAREQQYNQELQQAAQQLNSANGQIQQYQMMLQALQSAGIIRIGHDGQIFIPQGRFGGEDHEDDED